MGTGTSGRSGGIGPAGRKESEDELNGIGQRRRHGQRMGKVRQRRAGEGSPRGQRPGCPQRRPGDGG